MIWNIGSGPLENSFNAAYTRKIIKMQVHVGPAHISDNNNNKSTKIHVGPALNISDNCTVEGDVTTSSSYNVQIFLCPKKENCNLDFF